MSKTALYAGLATVALTGAFLFLGEDDAEALPLPEPPPPRGSVPDETLMFPQTPERELDTTEPPDDGLFWFSTPTPTQPEGQVNFATPQPRQTSFPTTETVFSQPQPQPPSTPEPVNVYTAPPVDITPAPTPTTTAYKPRNASGVPTDKIQAMLSTLGYFHGQVTGSYDDSTIEAVKAFQRAVNLKADGTVGAQTLEKLNDSIFYLTTKGNEDMTKQASYEELKPLSKRSKSYEYMPVSPPPPVVAGSGVGGLSRAVPMLRRW